MDDNERDNLSSTDEDVVDAEFEVIGASASPGETSLALAPTSAMEHGGAVRLGCAYCFRTLDPLAEDETLREAVRVNWRYYHRTCWEHSGETNQAAEPFTPHVPQPLRVIKMIGAPLYSGPLNTVNDLPLGISESVVILDSTAPASVMLRNNSDAPLHIDRRVMPLWAYVKYATQSASTHELALAPGEIVRLEIYPHPVRPGLETFYLALSDKQGFNLESQTAPLIPTAMLIGLYALFLGHISALLNMRFWFEYWGSYASIQLHLLLATLFSLFALFTALIYLAPAPALWGIYTLAQRFRASPIREIIAPVLAPVEAFALELIDRSALEEARTRWVMPVSVLLVAAGAVCALLVWILLLFLTAILGSLSDLFFLAELGGVLYLLYRFGLGYGFNLISFFQRLVRSGMSAYRSVHGSSGAARS